MVQVPKQRDHSLTGTGYKVVFWDAQNVPILNYVIVIQVYVYKYKKSSNIKDMVLCHM